jgi:hypothetical protein
VSALESELARLRAEVAAVREDIAALTRIARIAYDAGRGDALHGTPAPASKPPRRGRGKLRLVPGEAHPPR